MSTPALALQELLRAEPSLYAELVQLFCREGSPYEPRRVFDHLFVGHDAPADGAEDKVVRFRPREPNERLLAIEAFNFENRGGAGHSKTSGRREVRTLTGGEESG